MSIAALIIDMQEDFFAHERLSQRRAVLTENMNELVRICRESGVHVVWVKQEVAPDLSDGMLEAKAKGIRVVISGTPGAAILQELNYLPTDSLIVKTRYSAFFGTDLDGLLERSQATQLIIAGINTHACVRTTVIDAYQRDYEIILAQECIESHDAEHHDVSWRYMNGKLGRGLNNEQIRSLACARTRRQGGRIQGQEPGSA